MRSTTTAVAVLPALVVLSGGCATAPSAARLAVDRTIRPAWIPSPNKQHPDYVYVTGACRGIKHRFLARSCALLDAELKVRRLLKSSTAKVRSDFVEDEYFERRRVTPSASRLDYDWWVLVAFPREAATTAPAPTSQPAAAGADASEEQLLRRWRALDPEARRALMTILDKLAPR